MEESRRRAYGRSALGVLAGPDSAGQQTVEATALQDISAWLMLDERGIVRDCDSACELLFGHQRSDMLSHHVSMLLPQLADMELLKDGRPDSKLRYLCRIGVRFQMLNRNGERFPCDLFFNSLGDSASPRLRMIVRRDERQ